MGLVNASTPMAGSSAGSLVRPRCYGCLLLLKSAAADAAIITPQPLCVGVCYVHITRLSHGQLMPGRLCKQHVQTVAHILCACCTICARQVVASIKSGLSLQQQMNSFLEAAADCRQGGVAGRLRAVLKAQLQRWATAQISTAQYADLYCYSGHMHHLDGWVPHALCYSCITICSK
jgi:hypothetical protein